MKPLPKFTAETQHFWAAAKAGNLQYQRCTACKKIQFPPSLFCTACWSDALEWEVSKGRGSVHSFTIVERAPLAEFKADVPYVIALIDLDEGFRIMANIRGADARQVSIGRPVEIIFEPTERDDVVLPQAKLA
jgi:uncharacterized OB-fold protein